MAIIIRNPLALLPLPWMILLVLVSPGILARSIQPNPVVNNNPSNKNKIKGNPQLAFWPGDDNDDAKNIPISDFGAVELFMDHGFYQQPWGCLGEHGQIALDRCGLFKSRPLGSFRRCFFGSSLSNPSLPLLIDSLFLLLDVLIRTYL